MVKHETAKLSNVKFIPHVNLIAYVTKYSKKKIKIIFVFYFFVFAAPEVVIMDEKHHETSERYYKAGSAVELTCLATHIESPTDSVTWRLGTVTLKDGVR